LILQVFLFIISKSICTIVIVNDEDQYLLDTEYIPYPSVGYNSNSSNNI